MTVHNNNIGYIDLHTHILPGIDDGAESMDETLRMVDAAYMEGIRTIIATPHCGITNPGLSRSKAEEVLKATEVMVKEKYPDMEILMGSEIFYTGSSIIDDLTNETILTMAGTDYVLVEFSPTDPLKTIETGLRNLTAAGYRPILAHSERYEALYRDIDIVYELVELGTVIQINSRSLLRSKFDKRTRRIKRLLKKGLVHLISSDCHNDSSRSPVMTEAISKLRRLTDEETVKRITEDNPLKILQNRYL